MTQRAMTPKQSNVATLKGLKALEGMAQGDTGIIPDIDKRLIVWGEWRESGLGSGGMGRNPIAGMIEGRGTVARSTNPSPATLISDDVLDTDRAVCNIDDKLRSVVEIHYSSAVMSPAQKAAKLGISKATYYRRLWNSHRKVLTLLFGQR